MTKVIFSLIFIFILIGCSNFSDSFNSGAAAEKYGCSYKAAHFSSGTLIKGAYRCPKTAPKNFLSSNNCTWVNSYQRKDGTFVNGYMRCPIDRYVKQLNTSSSSNCHYVKGYYRKNGTYVKGHTRCR